LSLPELEATLNAIREKEDRERRFAASLKGIDLGKTDNGSVEERLEKVKLRARARLAGKDPDELALSDIGIATINEEE
jgi:hypothetical protein